MNIRHLLIFLLVSQLAMLAFADGCVGYNDSFYVRVLDAKLRPVPGAMVQITFDRGASFGAQYFTTPPRVTDANGEVYFQIANQGTNTRTIDCSIVANGTFLGETNTTTVQAYHHENDVDIFMGDLYPLSFYVRDQLRAPLENATVAIGNITGKTDQNGEFYSYMRTGSYEYLASYLDASQAGSFNVTDDTQYEVIFPYHMISIDVTDDTGTPLNASLTIFGNTFSMDNGHFENNRTFGDSIPFSIDYNGLAYNDTIIPGTTPDVVVHFDTHAPLFGNITPTVFNERPRLTIDVSDPNQYASGLDLSSISVQYKTEPADVTQSWNTAVTFTSARDQFTADFPQLPPNTIVDFRISIKDKFGNRADVQGTFTTYAGAPQGNSTQNQTNTQTTPPQSQGIPLIYIIGGVIIVILAGYMVFRIKSKPAGGP